jgi:hypothetical protein
LTSPAAKVSPIAEEARGRMASLWATQKDDRGQPQDRRVARRQVHAGPIFDRLRRCLQSQLAQIFGKTQFAQAIRHALAHLNCSSTNFDYSCLEPNRTCAERAVQSMALGKKNDLFIGSNGSCKAAATSYYLVKTATLNGIDLQVWLIDILGRVADH